MNFLSEILTSIAMLLGEPALPAQADDAWKQLTPWRLEDGYYVTSASSSIVPRDCSLNPSHYLTTPVIIQGTHRIFLDGRLVGHSGMKDGLGRSMNNSLVLSCRLLEGGKVVTWEVSNATRLLATLTGYPQVVERIPYSYVISTTAPAATAVVLLMLGILTFTLFHTTNAGARVNYPYLLANLFAGMHFALTVPESFGLQIPVVLLHKLHDIVLWVGTAFIWVVFRAVGSAPRTLQKIQLGSAIFAICIILFSSDLSQSQVGSTIAFLTNILMFLGLLTLEIRRLFQSGFKLKETYRFAAVSIFAVSGICDLLTHLGVWNMIPLYAVGYVGAMVFLAVMINDEIIVTYRERDHLRKNLEQEVEEKTAELKQQAKTLELAYDDLKHAKADALQAAKLASLGTLSAGIAHEINNSLNYVNGSLPPLKTILKKEALSDKDRSKSQRLLGLMQEGLDLTFEIIRNLKAHASATKTDFEAIDVKKSVAGTLLLLKSKLNNSIAVQESIVESTFIQANQTGFTQIMMNLIGNAIDALLESTRSDKLLTIVSADLGQKEIQISVKDNGIGMDQATLERVFDPFFTTKPEDKGTGLGLHIVRSEIEKIGGKLELESELGEGTTFTLILPKAGATHAGVGQLRKAS